MTYLILDLEISGETTYKRFCNPLDLSNEISIVSLKQEGKKARVISHERLSDAISKKELVDCLHLPEIDTIVGHNLKFDLLFFWDEPRFQEWLKGGGLLWDTLTAEYLLNGQKRISLNLDALALKYGGQVKDSRISTLFKEGVKTRDIPKDMIMPYAKEDVINTEIIYLNQRKKSRNLPIIKVYMKHYAAIIEMEFNGLYVDQKVAQKEYKVLLSKIEVLEDTLRDRLKPVVGEEIEKINFSSLDHISSVLFGGEIKYPVRRRVTDEDGNYLRYKSGAKKGEFKTRMEVKKVAVPGLKIPYKKEWLNKKGLVKTNDKVLSAIREMTTDEYETEIINLVVSYRTNLKLLTTYYYGYKVKKDGTIYAISGFLPLIMARTGCIHSEFKTSWTHTGRLASCNPNVQNIPPDCLDMFRSRWGAEGVICELDFSQLEVCIQAYLTQSENLIRDLRDGVDFHCKRLAYAEDLPYEEVVELCATSDEWKLKRKQAKVISFQKAYGAMPQTIATAAKMDIDIVNKVFEKEDKDYPEIKIFYEDIMNALKSTRRAGKNLAKIYDKNTGKVLEKEGVNEAHGYYVSIFGKYYSFEEKAMITQFGKLFKFFKLPEIQNYPIQGSAADVVAMQVSKVFEFLLSHRDKALLINEVHDSILLDIKKEHLDWTIGKITAILKDIEASTKEHFNLKFNVPIEVTCSYGDSWAQCK